jgi:hypothetical protein
MKPEGSLLHSQELSTCPYPEPNQSSPHHLILSIQDPSQDYPPTYVLVFLVVSFPLAFLPITYMHSSYPLFILHPPTRLIFFNMTTLITGEECNSQSSSLRSFLHPPVTSSLLNPNILLSTSFSNTPSLCSSLNVGDHVSQQYTATGKNYSVVYSNF